MKEENVNNIANISDRLDIAFINLNEADKKEELGDGSLYITLKRKMPKYMLTRFHRWGFESGEEENGKALRNWINQESAYYTIYYLWSWD